jgi:two-component system response regulator RegA
MSAKLDQSAAEQKLLLLDENPTSSSQLSQALTSHGYNVTLCEHGEQAERMMRSMAHPYVVMDVKLRDGSGLGLISRLKSLAPQARILVVTGHPSIATAVEAMKLGAVGYLAKPATTDQILAGLTRVDGDDTVQCATKPLSIRQLEWEYINWMLLEHRGNVSATAKALSMHRRTLQRKLFKQANKGTA